MRRWNLIASVGMLLPPGLVIGFYMYLGIFNRMLSDDYCTTYQAQHLGLLRSVWFWYLTWHGRFSANIADWLLSLSGSRGYPFQTLIFLSLWTVFAAIAVKEVLRFRGYSASNLLPALLLGVFLVFATLLLSPDISQSVFWWGGARSYLPPLILILLYIVLCRRFVASSLSRAQTVVWLGLSFGFVFFTGGFNETFTPLLVLLLAGTLMVTWLASKSGMRDRALLFLSIGFLGALCSLMVMVMAPGNSIRRAFYPPPPDLFTILKIASSGYFTFLSGIFSSPALLAGLLGVVLGAMWLGTRTQRDSGVTAPRGAWIFALLVAGFVLVFGCFPAAVYATSQLPPPRALITAAFFLVVSLLASGFAFGEWLANHTKNSSFLPATLFTVACLLIIFSSWDAFQNLYSVRAEHIAFAQKWDQVDAQIKEAKNSGLDMINIPAMKNWARAQYPTDNPRYYPNLCYSKFYDIQILAPPLQ